MSDRPLVRNAGSEKQVRRAARHERELEDRLLTNLAAVLTTLPGRALMWELLREARVYGSVWADHGQRMAFNVGQQDFGHMLLAKCLEADERLTELMEREGRAWQRREDQQHADAARADVTEGDQSNES